MLVNTQTNLIYVVFYYSDFIHIIYIYIYIYTCIYNNCNCHNKDTCSLPNSCQMKCIIYQANIDCDIDGYKQKCYLGWCETTFKDRVGNYKISIKHVKHKNDTELSKEF